MKKLISGAKCSFKKVVNVLYIVLCSFMLSTTSVYALNSNTSSIDTFIDFVCDWLIKIGGVVMLVGGVMFALSFQREDAEGKSRALMTIMAGGMVVGIALSKNLFGL